MTTFPQSEIVMKKQPTLEELGLDEPAIIPPDNLGIPPVNRKKTVAEITSAAPVAVTVDQTKICKFCKSKIDVDASKCPHCGEWIIKPKTSDWNGVASILSFFVPGLGQLYKGEIGNAIGCFVGTLIGYIFYIVPGIIFHIIVIIDAGRERQQKH